MEGKWWVPDTDNENFDGTLAFDHQLDRHVLTIISGPNFEISEMGNRANAIHDIILGETSDGQKVTLKDCERGGWRRNLNDLGRYSFTPTYILLGEHFKRSDDIVFNRIYITYSGNEINKWIKRVHLQTRIKSHDSAKVKVRDNYNVSVLGKPKLLSWSEGEVQKQSYKEVPCIEIESLKEQKKSLEEYLTVHLVVFDFLNFIITEEVHIESIQGIRENRKDSKENISANLQEEKKKR